MSTSKIVKQFGLGTVVILMIAALVVGVFLSSIALNFLSALTREGLPMNTATATRTALSTIRTKAKLLGTSFFDTFAALTTGLTVAVASPTL